MEKRCPLCSRKALKMGYCEIHSQAHENLKAAYQIWLRAFNEKLEFEEYLNAIYNLRETGEAVKEIIEEINSKEKS